MRNALLVALFISFPAFAAEPQILVAPNGRVIGTMVKARGSSSSAEPPLATIETTVVGYKPEVLPKATSFSVAPGRFIPVSLADPAPSYLKPTAAYYVQKLSPGQSHSGVLWSAPDGADASFWVNETKGPVYLVLARNAPGDYTLEWLKNGPADVGPVLNGNPLVITVTGARPPPQPPTPPTPSDPLAAAIQAAYTADTSPMKGADKGQLATVYRMCASSTTMDGIKTDADLYTILKGRTDSAIGPRLRGVRDVLAAELTKIEVPGSAARTLTAVDKAAVTSLLTRFAQILDGVFQ